MRIILQRVSEACVRVGGKEVGRIGAGFLALVGVGCDDNSGIADKMAEKITKLRVFADREGKTNLCSGDIGGEILVVSQFTLYADCRKGNRPSFTGAGSAEHARELYEHFADKCEGLFARVGRGVFGAHMEISLVNDGPFTLYLNSEEFGYNNSRV